MGVLVATRAVATRAVAKQAVAKRAVAKQAVAATAAAAMQAHLTACGSAATTRLADAVRNALPGVEALEAAVGMHQLEAAAAAAYAESGARGLRRYAVGQLLSVRVQLLSRVA